MAIKNPVFQSRENRKTPLLQAAIRIGAAFVVATVYLRHLLPVSDISFFITLRQSKPVQPREVVRKDLHLQSCCVGRLNRPFYAGASLVNSVC
jgi:hypothetical protein